MLMPRLCYRVPRPMRWKVPAVILATAAAIFGQARADLPNTDTHYQLSPDSLPHEGVPKGAKLPDGSRQISASGPVYRGPGAPAAGPMHHYTFEVFALDTKLDVPAGDDPWVVRSAVWKAMEGHVLGKAVYVGLFKRPE